MSNFGTCRLLSRAMYTEFGKMYTTRYAIKSQPKFPQNDFEYCCRWCRISTMVKSGQTVSRQKGS